jgi:hypothetical protein
VFQLVEKTGLSALAPVAYVAVSDELVTIHQF